MNKKTKRRKLARYKALQDVNKLLGYHLHGSTVGFSYFHNRYATDEDLIFYKKELNAIYDGLTRRELRLSNELFAS